MESLFLISGLGAPTGLEWLQLDHVLNVRGCICGRCVGKGAEVLWVIWAFIWYIGFRNKHSSSVFYWFGHVSGFDPKKTRTQNLGIKWIYRYIYHFCKLECVLSTCVQTPPSKSAPCLTSLCCQLCSTPLMAFPIWAAWRKGPLLV